MSTFSDIWKYFTKWSKEDATCNLCMKRLRTGGGTSNLRQHLNHKHPKYGFKKTSARTRSKEPLGEMEGDEDENDIIGNDDTTPAASPPACRSRSPPTALGLDSNSTSGRGSRASVRSERQTTLVEAVERIGSYERGGQKHVQITNALIYMICKDNESHSKVEKEGFKMFTKTVAPLYTLPSRNTVSQMVSLRYAAVISKIKERMQTVNHISLTADICTVTNTSRSFLVITGHFICPDDHEVETVMLGVRRLLEAHTGKYLSKEVDIVLNLFQIEKEKIVSFFTDGGANMISCARQLLGDGKSIQCLAHVLNLITTEGLEDNDNTAMKQVVENVKRIVTFARQSNVCMDALRRAQEDDGVVEGKILLLIQSVSTRWNSTYYMIERFVKLSPYMARILANPNLKNAPHMLSGNEIDLLTEIIQILTPFEQATKEILGSDYLTGSLVLPMLNCIDSALRNVGPIRNDGSKVLHKKLLEILKKRSLPLQQNPLLCRASLADPRFKKLYMDPLIASRTVTHFSTEIQKLSENSHITHPESSSSSAQQFENTNALWSNHDKRFDKPIPSTSMGESTFPSELKLYLQQPLLPRTQNPVNYWLQSQTCIPDLSQIAMKYLTTIGSSVPSERLVSTVNNIVSDERTRLTNKHITERVFMHRLNKKYWIQ